MASIDGNFQAPNQVQVSATPVKQLAIELNVSVELKKPADATTLERPITDASRNAVEQRTELRQEIGEKLESFVTSEKGSVKTDADKPLTREERLEQAKQKRAEIAEKRQEQLAKRKEEIRIRKEYHEKFKAELKERNEEAKRLRTEAFAKIKDLRASGNKEEIAAIRQELKADLAELNVQWKETAKGILTDRKEAIANIGKPKPEEPKPPVDQNPPMQTMRYPSDDGGALPPVTIEPKPIDTKPPVTEPPMQTMRYPSDDGGSLPPVTIEPQPPVVVEPKPVIIEPKPPITVEPQPVVEPVAGTDPARPTDPVIDTPPVATTDGPQLGQDPMATLRAREEELSRAALQRQVASYEAAGNTEIAGMLDKQLQDMIQMQADRDAYVESPPVKPDFSEFGAAAGSAQEQQWTYQQQQTQQKYAALRNQEGQLSRWELSEQIKDAQAAGNTALAGTLQAELQNMTLLQMQRTPGTI